MSKVIDNPVWRIPDLENKCTILAIVRVIYDNRRFSIALILEKPTGEVEHYLRSMFSPKPINKNINDMVVSNNVLASVPGFNRLKFVEIPSSEEYPKHIPIIDLT